MTTGRQPEGKRLENDRTPAESRGFSIQHMDISADPLTDFYNYAAGKWAKRNPIPSDKSHWGAFEELSEENTDNLRKILETCSDENKKADNSVERLLGDFYFSAMNTDAIEKAGFSPLNPYMKEIDGIDSIQGMLSCIARMHSSGIFPFFNSYSQADKKNSNIYAMNISQGGLSLPNRDYYLSDEFSEIRGHYLKHIEKVFTIYGASTADAVSYSKSILELETELANSSRSQAELRDAEKNYNQIPATNLDSRFPLLNLGSYLPSLGVPKVDYIVVGQPEFFDFLNSTLSRRTLDELKLYLKWTVLNDAAPYLFSEIEDEHFDMFNRKIRGQPEPEPRWKRSVHDVDLFVGEALGELYIKEHFGPEAKERMTVLVEDIKEAFKERLKNLPWMAEETKRQALLKFEKFSAKIGHPDKFRDYSSITVKRDDFFGNISRTAEFEVNRQMKRVGTPVDRSEWFMTPPTINAYFSPPDNEIVFPAGILQPPFFDVTADDAVNYGAIGAVISHEITHGYDDQGRRYDENGNLREWWGPDDEKNFMERAKRVVNLYNSLEVFPGLHVNGELTLGENIADFGGVTIAYDALQRHLSKNPQLRRTIDGFTPEQRFFISWAQLWRQNILDPEARMRITVDPHSPNKFRANVPAYNHPEFENAFPGNGKNAGTKARRGKIDIW